VTYKTKARVFYDEFGGIAVIDCSDIVKAAIKSSDIWEIFETGENERSEPGLYEVELHGHRESCDCYELCSHDGHIVFEMAGLQRLDINLAQAA
jgi:hypothetical protein